MRRSDNKIAIDVGGRNGAVGELPGCDELRRVGIARRSESILRIQ